MKMCPRRKVLGRCVPWSMRPLDYASFGRRVPWTTRPLNDASLTDISQPWTAKIVRVRGHIGWERIDIAAYSCINPTNSRVHRVQVTKSGGRVLKESMDADKVFSASIFSTRIRPRDFRRYENSARLQVATTGGNWWHALH